MDKIIAVVGPTASGKTAIGVQLALKFNGAIVSADAKQVYRGMNIGTAKETTLPVPQYLIDIKDPGTKITVGEYQAEAYKVIDHLLAAKTLPILVGGSGLYVESVLEGYLFGGPGTKEHAPRYQSLKIGIEISREQLKARAVVRLQERLGAGLITEVEGLRAQGVDPDWLERCGIEYRWVNRYLAGTVSNDELQERITIATNQFIKRQYTWWRRHSDIKWVSSAGEAAQKVAAFLAL